MTTFQSMGLPDALNRELQNLQFNEPTPIQAKAIPPALQGKDVLGSANTGTGKTLAFGIPLVARLISNPRGSALVMTPTRELATQVMAQLQTMLGKHSAIKTALLIGGDSMQKQLRQLSNRPRLLVGTPGRINDHLKRKSLMLDRADFLVLDETDRMLDMGFTVQIENVMKYMASSRQTLLFSATMPQNIVRVAEKYLNDPVRVSVDATPVSISIKQETLHTNEAEKYQKLLSQLDVREGSVIIFMKTKYSTEKMATKLSKEGHKASAIHGDLRQNKRDRVIDAFRKQKSSRILVATDVAARGLDIPHIEHVINYDLPQCAEDYIHRIGRTARAGAEGSALSLITSADKGKWNAIDRLLNPGNHNPLQKQGKNEGFKAKRKPRGGASFHKRNKSSNFKARREEGGAGGSSTTFNKRRKPKSSAPRRAV